MAFNKLPVEILEQIFQYLDLTPRQIFLFSLLTPKIKRALSSFPLIFRTKDYFIPSKIHNSKQFKGFEAFVRNHTAKKIWLFTKQGEIHNFKNFTIERECYCLMIGAGGNVGEGSISGKSGGIKFFKTPTPNQIWAKPGRAKEKDHPSRRGGASLVKFQFPKKKSKFKVLGGLFGECSAGDEKPVYEYYPDIIELGLKAVFSENGLLIHEKKPKLPCLGNTNHLMGFGAGGRISDCLKTEMCKQCKILGRGRNGLVIVYI